MDQLTKYTTTAQTGISFTIGAAGIRQVASENHFTLMYGNTKRRYLERIMVFWAR